MKDFFRIAVPVYEISVANSKGNFKVFEFRFEFNFSIHLLVSRKHWRFILGRARFLAGPASRAIEIFFSGG